MQKSLFAKYFSLCAAMVIISITILGAVFLIFASQYFKNDKYRLLETNTVRAADALQVYYEEDRLLKDQLMVNYMKALSQTIDSTLFLTSTDGQTIFCTETPPCRHTDSIVSKEVRKTIEQDGRYSEMGKLGGMYEERYYTCLLYTSGLLLDGVIGGISGILVFLPQRSLLFFCLSLWEDSGYMARAAFLMDRVLRRLGLSGKSFIPMLMGFGCTTPAVMAARALENEKDRRMTIMLTPFMSCGARLPIYAIFAGVFFPKKQGLVVFGLYLLGILVAVLAGIFLKKTVFRGETAPFVLELPPYRMPQPLSVLRHVWEKVKGFLVKAGTLIFAMSVLLWLAKSFSPSLRPALDAASSILGVWGEAIAPVFSPLGFGTWQAAVALLTGLIAKESVVSSLTVLYAGGNAALLPSMLAASFTPASAMAFMAFCLLYMPCISAFATIVKEMNSLKWALGTAALSTGAAYTVSFLVYHIARLFF